VQILLMLLGVMVITSLPVTILFFNYYLYARDKVLTLSKGNDLFYYGFTGNPEKFNKNDIEQAFFIRRKAYKSSINGFAILEVCFKDNTTIRIPSIFVSPEQLLDKFTGVPITESKAFPWLKYK